MLAAGFTSLVAQAISYFSSLEGVVSGLTGNLGTVENSLGGSSLWASMSYLLGLDVALKAFCVALPTVLLGFVGVLIAAAGVFFTAMLAVAAYVAIKRVIKTVTCGFGQV